MRPARRLVFRIIYTSIYVLLCIITAGLLLIVPGDIASQAILRSHTWVNVVILAIVYALALLIILFVYVTRLFITRMALAAIPRAYVPIEKGDITKEVRKMIAVSLSHSAAVAWAARPKVTALVDSTVVGGVEDAEGDFLLARESSEKPSAGGRRSFQALRLSKTQTVEEEMGIALPPLKAVWGHIEHNGWGSPNLADLPNLQYSTVLAELPDLIEAKAITQAPPSPDSPEDTLALDPDAVDLLERQHYMTMRQYLDHLTSVNVLPNSPTKTEFLKIYEYGRFSVRPMSEDTFRRLMHLFADLLRSMQPLHPSVLYDTSSTELDEEDEFDDGDYYEESEGGHIDDDAPQDTSPTTPARSIARSRSMRSVQSSLRSRTSIRRPAVGASSNSSHPVNNVRRSGSWRQMQQQQFRTAPNTPASKFGGGRKVSNSSRSTTSASGRSFAQTRKPYPASQMSGSSLGRSNSQGSQSGGSVIRLATADDDGDLPYVLRPIHSSTL